MRSFEAKRFELALGLALLCAAPAFAQADAGIAAVQPISAEAKVDKDKVQLGEPFQYTIRITHASDQRYELTTPHELGPFEVLSLDRSRDDQKGKSVTTFTLKLDLFEIGTRTIPTLTFQEVDAAGVHQFKQEGPEVEGVGVLNQTQIQNGESLADIKGNEQVPVRSWKLIWWLLGFAALAAATFYAVRAYRRLREAPVPPAPPKPLHERTIAALDALKAEAPHRAGKQREFYFRLSEIVRSYLGERFRFDALECTSSELINRLKEKSVDGFPLGDFSSFVHESDLAKYAKAELPLDTCDGALGFAYRVVELTHPPAVVPVDASGAQLPQS